MSWHGMAPLCVFFAFVIGSYLSEAISLGAKPKIRAVNQQFSLADASAPTNGSQHVIGDLTKETGGTELPKNLNRTYQQQPQRSIKRLLLYSIFVNRADAVFNESVTNLRFFIQEGIFENNGVDYVFLMIQGSDPFVDADRVKFPKFPNVRVMDQPNEGIDTCVFGAVLGQMDLSSYDYVAFMNVGARGPFMKHADPYWLDQFVNQLASHNAVMMGPMFSCENAPHIQTHFMILDTLGVQEARERWLGICTDSISHSDACLLTEVGLSTQFLDEGYNLSSITTSETINAHNVPQLCQQFGDRNPSNMTDLDPYRYVVLKFGGDLLRENMLSPDLMSLVHIITQKILD